MLGALCEASDAESIFQSLEDTWSHWWDTFGTLKAHWGSGEEVFEEGWREPTWG